MAKFIELNMVRSNRDSENTDHIYRDTDEPGEGNAPSPSQGGEQTTPMLINTDSIKSVYRRKPRQDGSDRVGCRINFTNGGGVAVTDTYDILMAALMPSIT